MYPDREKNIDGHVDVKFISLQHTHTHTALVVYGWSVYLAACPSCGCQMMQAVDGATVL